MYQGKSIRIELNRNNNADTLHMVAGALFILLTLAMLVYGVVEFSAYTETLAATAQNLR